MFTNQPEWLARLRSAMELEAALRRPERKAEIERWLAMEAGELLKQDDEILLLDLREIVHEIKGQA